MKERPAMTKEKPYALVRDGQWWAQEQLAENNLSFVY